MSFFRSQLPSSRSAPWFALAITVLITGCTSTPEYPDVRCPEHAHAHGDGPVFVIDQLAIDPTDNPDVVHTGFDLDGLVSTDNDPLGCAHADYFALYDFDQNCARVSNERCLDAPIACSRRSTSCAQGTEGCRGAIDNQLPNFVNTFQFLSNTDPRMELSEQITTSRVAFVLQVVDIDDRVNDSSVRVRLFRAHAVPGASCTNIRSGATYQIDRASLGPGGTLDDALVEIPGEIVDSRVRAGGDDSVSIRIPTTLAGIDLPFDVQRIRIAFDLGTDELSRGNLGGFVRVQPLVAPLTALPPPAGVSIARGFLAGVVDIAIDGVCDGSSMGPPRYGGMSVGYGLHAIPAVIDSAAPIVDAASPGSCEALATDGGADAASD